MQSDSGQNKQETLPSITIELAIKNTKSQAIEFCLEPWGDHCIMNPGATFTVMGEGPDGGTLEIEYEKDAITVYGWTGSTLMAYYDGVAVCKGNVIMPGLPPNMTTKGFVDLMFKPNNKPPPGKF